MSLENVTCARDFRTPDLYRARKRPLNFPVKIQKKYQNLGHKVLMVTLEKDRRGLGISLAGHKDRNRMAVFICGLNPKGAAYKNGGLLIGDEILEVAISLLPSLLPSRVFTTCHLRPRFPTSSGCLTFVSRAVHNPFNSPVATLRVAGFHEKITQHRCFRLEIFR